MGDEGMRRAVSAFFAASFAFVATSASAEDDGWGRDYYADISASSQLFSLGSVRADHSVWMMEADFAQRLSAFGHVLLGYWSLSDLGGSGDRSRRSYVYESDPSLFYGYDWNFADGWRLRNRIGMIWVFNEGYNVDVTHLFREWTYMGELKSPLVTLRGQVRVVDGLGTYVRIGAFRSFDIAGGVFSLAPHLSLHGGSGRWNRNRYGDFAEGRSIPPGLGTVDYGVRLGVPLEWGMSWYLDVGGYDALDSRTRTQIRERRRRGSTMKLDACLVTSGFCWEF